MYIDIHPDDEEGNSVPVKYDVYLVMLDMLRKLYKTNIICEAYSIH